MKVQLQFKCIGVNEGQEQLLTCDLVMYLYLFVFLTYRGDMVRRLMDP